MDPLKYQTKRQVRRGSGELMTVKVRYKHPEGRRSRLLSKVVPARALRMDDASQDTRFASAVAAFGLLLRRSPSARGISMDQVRELASGSLGEDRHGLRREFLELVEAADGQAHRLSLAR